MPRGDLPALATLDVADPPDVWRRLGFAVEPAGECRIGAVTIRLLGPAAGSGIVEWGLRAASRLPSDVDGIPTTTIDPATDPAASGAHPNGATHLDHVVVTTANLGRTLAALEAIGLEVRRTREAGTPARPLRQAFLWAGDTLVEVAGPPEPRGDAGDGARIWGLMVVVPSLENPRPASTDSLVGSVHDAVQPGRRIVTVRREAGSSVPLAFMTPHIGRATPEETGNA